jgi:hypothetical protein
MRNEQVVMAWLTGRSASTKSLSTDGQKLWSYKLLIGDRSDGLNRVWDYTASGRYVSQMTSCHVGLAIRETPSMVLMTPK